MTTDARSPRLPADRASGEAGDEAIQLPPPKADPGSAGVDDHVAAAPLGLGHQPIDELDPGVDPEHLDSPSQGVKVERPPEEGERG
jgi:hypothetical protein